MLQFVFGYGSLAASPGPALTRATGVAGFVVNLPGFVRTWGVAMDNRRDLPGYKYYTRPDGYRPAVYVTFLDLVQAAGAPPNGVCLPVTDSELGALDERERNYHRIDVSDRIDAGARVWTYVGSPEGRERRERGMALATAVVDAGYLAAVRAGFAALGRDEAATAAGSLAPGHLPVVQLVRHELA